MAGLPPAATEEAFAAIGQDEAVLRPGIGRLCQRLGVDAARLARYAAGSRPVYRTADLVLKLLPPVATWPRWQIEPKVLAAVQGRLPIPTPQVHAAGEHDGWGYVLMSRLPGVPLDTVWDQVPAAGRDRLVGQLGETIAALHQLPPPAIRDWWPADWPAFVARQRALTAEDGDGDTRNECEPRPARWLPPMLGRWLTEHRDARIRRCPSEPADGVSPRNTS